MQLKGKSFSIPAVVFSISLVASAVLVPSASAGVVGPFSFSNCDGGGVTVNLTAIEFLPQIAAVDEGCIDSGLNTSVSFDGGTLGAGETGSINWLTNAMLQTGFNDFIAFAGVDFNLGTIGPGLANTTCSTTDVATNPGCSAVAGSPFILTPNGTGTTITLDVSGLATDGNSSNSTWQGAFTTQLSLTPAQIQSMELAGDTITSTYSFQGSASLAPTVPEPVTTALVGGGLIAIACLKRRKSRV
jgi:hypothetical protein